MLWASGAHCQTDPYDVYDKECPSDDFRITTSTQRKKTGLDVQQLPGGEARRNIPLVFIQPVLLGCSYPTSCPIILLITCFWPLHCVFLVGDWPSPGNRRGLWAMNMENLHVLQTAQRFLGQHLLAKSATLESTVRMNISSSSPLFHGLIRHAV